MNRRQDKSAQHSRKNITKISEDTANLRDVAAHAREDTANLRDVAAHAREDTANLRDVAAHAREDTANLRDVAAHAHEGSANLRDVAAHAREDTANSRDVAAHARENTANLRDIKSSSREHNIQTIERKQAANEDHMLMLQQANERLVIATIESQALAEQLQLTKYQLEKASQAKSNFLSSMSHELRTPLNAILGFAQLLESGTPQPTESQNKRLQQIIKAGWYLLELINEILDLSVIESGKLLLHLEPVSLADVSSECQSIIQELADKRKIQVNFSQCDDSLLVIADRTRLKQVLINLLSNAIKYNRIHGTAELSCKAISADRLRICVSDSGNGLSTEKLQQLFQPFNRLGQESGTEEGTGIGLVVARQLVELMGGSIGVESTIGVGSKFWIELLRSSVPSLADNNIASVPAQTLAHTQLDAPQLRLLYVEDNPANLQLVEEILAERPNIIMLSAHDGHFGIELARTYLPDVILMDVNLPGISGVETMHILRGNPSTRHIPIIALSANAMLKDVEIGLAAGFFHYLTKPIKIHEFNSVVDNALNYAAAAKIASSMKGELP